MYCDTGGQAKLARLVTAAANGQHEAPLVIEDQQMVVEGFDNIDVAIPIDGNAFWFAEFTQSVAMAAKLCHWCQLLIKYLYPEIHAVDYV